jgi:arylsulfatase B
MKSIRFSKYELYRITKYIFLPFILVSLLSCNNILKSKIPEKNPNILVMIADDVGWSDVIYNGSEIHTPNIDSLAKKREQLNRFDAHFSFTCRSINS